MSTEVKVNLTVTGTEQATKSIDKVDDATKGLEGNVDAATGALDKMTGGAVSGFKNMVKGVKGVIMGMKGFRAAMISTGVGALVVAVGSLIAYFTQTQRGAEKLEVAMSVLKGVTQVLTDNAIALGESIFNAFSNPKQALIDFGSALKQYVTDKVNAVIQMFGLLGSAVKKVFERDFEGAMEDASSASEIFFNEANILKDVGEAVVDTFKNVAESVGETTKRIKANATAASDLAKASIQLRKDQRKLRVEFAEGRAQFKEYNMIAEDLNATLEDRLVAAQAAIDIEQSLMAERQRVAAEELRIHKQTMALGENTEEDMERLTELEVALINIREESAERQTTINNKLNIIRNQAAAEAQKLSDEEQALLKQQEDAYQLYLQAVQSAQDNEIDAVNAKYDKLFDTLTLAGQETAGLVERQQAEVAAITKKYLDKEVQDTKDAEDKKRAARVKGVQQALQVGQAFMSFMQTQNQAGEEATEEAQRQAFERSKKLQISGALMSMASAIIGALAAPPVGLGPTPAGFAASATAALMGAAQIATIKQQQFNSTTSGSAESPQMTRALVPDNLPVADTTPTLENRQAEEPMRAYVVSQEITSQQQLDAALSHRSQL
jgi:hypothetical protein